MAATKLHFDVSTGLKSVLGSDLITNDEVAVFELVKNSFDANARHVDIYFADDSIVICDDGDGMSLEDIKEKWLFVAYSAKRNGTKPVGFRDTIADRRHFAGSKGIGRFSSDRLGEQVVIQTRPKKGSSGTVHVVSVDWTRFDVDHKEHFESVGVAYSDEKTFDLPKGVRRITHGTLITVNKTRQEWDRERILGLKSALSKLINPFGAVTDNFTISIIAPNELDADAEERKRQKKSGEEAASHSIVNGEIRNFIFETLKEKTTFIDVKITEDAKHIESSLTDRGELIYKIREPNVYSKLKVSSIACQVYFLNTSAKQTFARRMGVPSVQFGSVLLFRNGFRVFPVGEEGDDWFEMDRRKQQGYARFLGTRDVIGKLEVEASGGYFEEPSSRDTGLIENSATEQLRDFFMDHCLKRLERYVVPVTFVDKEDRVTDDVSRLLTDPGRARVSSVVARLVDNDGVELLKYSTKLVRLLSERSEQFEGSLASLRAIAEHTKDSKLYNKIEEAEKRFSELRRSEEAARRQADDERAAKEAAQSRAEKAERAAHTTAEQLAEERKRNLFLTSITSLDTDTIINLHHQITIYAIDIERQIENFLVGIAGTKSVPTKDVLSALDSIALLNRRVSGIARFATKANFRLESEKIKEDLPEYIEQYVKGVARDFVFKQISLSVKTDGKPFVLRFKPIDISVVIENLITNAKKARASKIHFDITQTNKDSLHVAITDNGRGFNNRIDDLSRVFEKGFTTTDGSGLGLYHVQQVLGEMNGTIEATRGDKGGASFLIRIAK